MKKQMFFIILSMILLSGCDRAYDYFSKAYVQWYSEIAEVRLSVPKDSENEILFHTEDGVILDFRDQGPNSKVFEKVCKEHGDFSYNRDVSLIMDWPKIGSFYPDILEISVYSNKDFDSAHPAGEPLNDLVELTYGSVKDYVRSGYKNKNEIVQIKKSLDKMVPEDYILFFLPPASECGSLKFTTLPQDMSEHIITVKVKTAAVKVFEASIPFTFKKSE